MPVPFLTYKRNMLMWWPPIREECPWPMREEQAMMRKEPRFVGLLCLLTLISVDTIPCQRSSPILIADELGPLQCQQLHITSQCVWANRCKFIPSKTMAILRGENQKTTTVLDR
jgi:hypothetical protein